MPACIKNALTFRKIIGIQDTREIIGKDKVRQ